MTKIDHLILNVNEIPSSVDFYVEVLGFKLEGEDGPFTVIRVSDDFTLQLAPCGTKGNEHYAFAMSRQEFDATFARIKQHGIPYGDSYLRSVPTGVRETRSEPEARRRRCT